MSSPVSPQSQPQVPPPVPPQSQPQVSATSASPQIQTARRPTIETNFEYNRWDKIPGAQSSTFTYRHEAKDGTGFTIEQEWSNTHSDEFIIGSMRALAELYENANPKVRDEIQDKLKNRQFPLFVEILGTSDANGNGPVIGYMITWPPSDGDTDDNYFIYSKDENGNFIRKALFTKPAEHDAFLKEVADSFTNREDTGYLSHLSRLANRVSNKIFNTQREVKPYTINSFITAPNEFSTGDEGQMPGGLQSIQDRIKELAEHLKTPKPTITAEQIGAEKLPPPLTTGDSGGPGLYDINDNPT
jgi:hypothetical protein